MNDEDKRPGGDTAAEEPELAGISEELHEEVLRERDEYLDSLKRLQADFDNYRKRVMRETEQIRGGAAAEVIGEIVPVLDNFERALKAVVEHDEKALKDGIELVYTQLRDILTRHGLCEIEAGGQEFDPGHHEAVLCQPSKEHPEGEVMQVLEKGYRVGDRIVRPARVIVSGGPGEDKSSGRDSDTGDED